MNAVLALGLVGAGTNNARLAGILRQLSAYYFKEPTLLFLVRVAQVGLPLPGVLGQRGDSRRVQVEGEVGLEAGGSG
jgi:hypothetical protein